MMICRKAKILAVCFLAATLFSLPLQAQNVLRIAAVVNDDIISAEDLAQRIRLTMATSRIPNTPQVRQRLARTTLRTMIDERLKAQEAERLKIEVEDSQIKTGLGGFSRSIKVAPNQLPQFLQSIGVDTEVVEDQAAAEIGWSLVLTRDGGARILVSEEEIDAAMTERNANKGKPEYLYAEIYIPNEEGSQGSSAAQMAASLIEHLQNGSPFSSLARDFSQSPSATDGGLLGWVQSGHIDPNIENVLAQMPEGGFSRPIQTPSGYYIVNLLEKRISGAEDKDDSLDLAQVILPVGPDAPQDTWNTANALARDIAYEAKTCDHVVELGQKVEGAKAGKLSNLKLSQMPADIRQTLAPLKENQITTLEQRKGAVLVLMVCKRIAPPPTPEIAVRKELEQKLRLEKIGRESRRRLQLLRRSAFVDIRL